MQYRQYYVLLLSLWLFISSGQTVHAEISETLKKKLSIMNVGTAFSVAPGFIVTNKHVVGEEKNVVFLTSDETSYAGRWIADDPDNDLSLFYAETAKTAIKPLPLANQQGHLGESVFTIGFPHPNVLGLSPKLTTGIINATSGFEDNPNTYQVSVQLQSGNSGGPLINTRGEVLGVTSMKLNAERLYKLTGDIPQNINYAIKAEPLKRLLDKVHARWKVKTQSAKNRPLTDMAAELKNNIVLVLAGNTKLQLVGPDNDNPLDKSLFTNDIQRKQKFAVFVYAAPEGRVELEDYQNELTTKTYSNYVFDVVSDELKKLSDKSVNISFKRKAKKAIDYLQITENKSKSLALCQKEKIQTILSVEYDVKTGLVSRNVNFRIFDCESKFNYKQTVNISYHHADKFATEVQFRDKFFQFINSMPSKILWTGR